MLNWIRKTQVLSLLAALLVCVTLASATARAASDDNDDDDAPPSHSTKYRNLSSEQKAVLDQGEIPTELHVIGGVVGTFIGFGLGHAVERRYSSRGWIFTVGEAGSLALLGIGATECGTSATDWRNTNCSNSATFLGALGFIGFRIWEVVDVWAGPAEDNRRYRNLKRHLDKDENKSKDEMVFLEKFTPGPIVTREGGVGMGLQMHLF